MFKKTCLSNNLLSYIYIYIYIYTYIGVGMGVHDEIFNVVENGHDNASSNPGLSWWSFT